MSSVQRAACSVQPAFSASRRPLPASGKIVPDPAASVLGYATPRSGPDSVDCISSRPCWRLEAGGWRRVTA
jgi:hypothetical protein